MELKRLIKMPLRAAARRLIKAGVIPDVIIVNVDGGICSQMHFRLIGEMLRRRGNRVVYNLDWFDKNGRDLDGVRDRLLELPLMFPDSDFKIISNKLMKRLYFSLFYHFNDYFDDKANPYSWLDLKSPMWVEGYFHDPIEMFGPLFDETFQQQDVKNHYADLNEKDGMPADYGNACAVHVRRGDLSKFNRWAGNPVPSQYFIEACNLVAGQYPDVTFHIFSDDPDWCRDELLPCLEVQANVCSSPDSRAYADLLHMAKFRHIITSQGSMGKYAALLRDPQMRDGIVVLTSNPNSEGWSGVFSNCVTLDFGK